MSNYCPACRQHESDAESKYCSSCGAMLTASAPKKKCSACGEELRNGAAYCTSCGAKQKEVGE